MIIKKIVRMKTFEKKKESMISASEIAQYHYCSVSWYLQRHGFRPNSETLNIGKKEHVKLGEVIDDILRYRKKSKLLTKTGGILIIIAIIIFLIKEILIEGIL